MDGGYNPYGSLLLEVGQTGMGDNYSYTGSACSGPLNEAVLDWGGKIFAEALPPLVDSAVSTFTEIICANPSSAPNGNLADYPMP